MDIAAMKAKLAKLSGDKTNTGMFRPVEGDTIIRILPLANSENPFQELLFHYNLIKGKTFLSPLSFDERDPVVEFKDTLLTEGGRVSKDEFKMIMHKFNPQVRTYALVIERGKENEGPKYWGFGQTTYKQLLAIAADDDYGDFTNPDTGFDLKVTFTPQEKSDTNFSQTKIMPRPKSVPLSKDKAQTEKWLTNQPNLLIITGYDKYSYSQLEAILHRAMNPEEATGTSDVSVVSEALTENSQFASEPSPVVTTAESVTPMSDDVAAEFDALFNEEK